MSVLEFIISILLENKLLLLFLVIAIGYFLGRISIFGFSLGIAAVLFVGIFFGSLHPEMVLPDIVYILGLVLFVYTIGLRSGASFFASLKKSGLRDNLFVLGVLIISALLTKWMGSLLQIKNTLLAGVFAGSLTNTPALASVIDILKLNTQQLDAEALRVYVAEPVIGYSLSYPIGVIGVLLLFQLAMKAWHINMKEEQKATSKVTGITQEEVTNLNVLVTNPDIVGKTIDEIEEIYDIDLIISRRKSIGSDKITIPAEDTDPIFFQDTVTLIGTPSNLDKMCAILGEKTDQDLSLERGKVDYRRIFVSNKKVIGKTIAQLELHNRFQAVITRLRRGDVDLPIQENMVLEAGDRVRVIAPRENMTAISKFLGDSFQHLSEVDYISMSIGIALGLLLGMIPIPLPNGASFKLGFAAGALIVALILGKIGRSGKIIWTMSYNSNFTLRQMGAVFFLAGIGLKAGYSFVSTFQESGFELILFGACNTIFTAGVAILTARFVFRIPFNLMMGMVSALHTQPACLAFANEKDETGAANISYATVFPTAMIVKIILVQWMLG
ncbi:MAG: TrkA C-terminal domain-containing protein [Microscillaceae bacterium]|nr:TrkA C-terminal domain-containing protein [Microscillaceae bacterium]